MFCWLKQLYCSKVVEHQLWNCRICWWTLDETIWRAHFRGSLFLLTEDGFWNVEPLGVLLHCRPNQNTFCYREEAECLTRHQPLENSWYGEMWGFYALVCFFRPVFPLFSFPIIHSCLGLCSWSSVDLRVCFSVPPRPVMGSNCHSFVAPWFSPVSSWPGLVSASWQLVWLKVIFCPF